MPKKLRQTKCQKIETDKMPTNQLALCPLAFCPHTRRRKKEIIWGADSEGDFVPAKRFVCTLKISNTNQDHLR